MLSGLPGGPIRLSGLVAPETGLRPGQAFQTVVRGAGEALLLELGEARVHLEPGVPLAAGARVRVEIQAADAGLRIVVTPQPPPGAETAARDAALAHVLRALDAAGLGARGAGLVPRALPPLETPLRQLFTVLLAQGQPGDDVQALAALVQQAAAQGALPAGLAALVAGIAAQAQSGAPGQLQALVERLARNRSTEARIAEALRSGLPLEEALAGDLRAALGRLAGEAPLRAWLRARGAEPGFDALVQRLADHAAGAQHQNLHGLREAYVFVPLPLPAEAGWRHAHVHFFAEGRPRRGADGPGAWHAVIDCSTTQLGDLWVQLRAAGGHCQCRFRTAASEAAAALEAAAPELRDALIDSGFAHAEVLIDTWAGARLDALLALMARYRGLSAEA